MDRKNKYIAILAICFIITIALFYILVDIKQQQIYKLDEDLQNATLKINIGNAIITTYQDHICKYESLYVQNTNEIWNGSIDTIEIRKANDDTNQTILNWAMGCYNQTNKEQLVIFYRFPPAEPLSENNTNTTNI